MESLFFGAGLGRYQDRMLETGLHQIDVSNGLVYIESPKEINASLCLHNLDRMVMIIFVQYGNVKIVDDEHKVLEQITDGKIAFCTSKKQNWTIEFKQSDAFVLLAADFFLKRYIDDDKKGALEDIYEKMMQGGSLECIERLPLDALSLYLIKKIKAASMGEHLRSMRGEHRIMELLMHQLGRLKISSVHVDSEDLRIASKAKEILEIEFVQPLSIDELAHKCATNSTKLKKVFKKVYSTTIYSYIQKLRMEEANLLLREEIISIGEVARRVGYRHQGHFSQIFYQRYGIYPKELK